MLLRTTAAHFTDFLAICDISCHMGNSFLIEISHYSVELLLK